MNDEKKLDTSITKNWEWTWNKQDKILNDVNKKMEDRYKEKQLQSFRNKLALWFAVLLLFLFWTSYYMSNIKAYPEKIVEKPIDRIVEKPVEKIVNTKTTTFYIPRESYVNVEIQTYKGTKKYGEFITALSKADDKILNSKMYIYYITDLDETWKEINKIEVKQGITVKEFLKGNLVFTQ